MVDWKDGKISWKLEAGCAGEAGSKNAKGRKHQVGDAWMLRWSGSGLIKSRRDDRIIEWEGKRGVNPGGVAWIWRRRWIIG